MTEQEWMACTEPEKMLAFVNQQPVAEAIGIPQEQRKERLFGCACCWQVEALMLEARCLEAVRAAEQLADDLVDADRHEELFWLTHEIAEELREQQGEQAAAFLAARLANLLFEESSEIAYWAYGYLLDLTAEAVRPSRQAWGKQVIHCIWGPLPFRPLPPKRGKRRWKQQWKRWLSWHSGLLVSMAQKMYDSRDFTDMPVLADALDEAGCQDQDILSHCRSGGEHVRGCWLVDLLLDKK
jgi:hypothetical protein